MEIQVQIVEQVMREVDRQGLTHAALARRSGTSRTRITAILNGNLDQVSTDLLLRILSSLGIRAKIGFAHVRKRFVEGRGASGRASPG
jgi:transcriptional regulator with XRE-family HTH domain